MLSPNIDAILDSEKVRLDSELAATPAPTLYGRYAINKTLSLVSRMRQGLAESDEDYVIRVNFETQAAPAGYWSTSFFFQLDAAIAADTAEGSRGGKGRSD